MPRFQFTIRGLLWITFWVAVSVAAWTIPPLGPQGWEGLTEELFVLGLRFTAPFAILSVLFYGRLVAIRFALAAVPMLFLLSLLYCYFVP